MGILDSAIKVNGRFLKISGRGDSHLLDILADQGVFLPAACGGHGSCGLCTCRFLSRVPEVGALEKPYLNQEQIDRGYRLACQHGLQAGLELELPETLLQTARYPARVQAVENLAPGVCRLELRPDSPQKIIFHAGQWMRIEIPIAGVMEHRAFSLSSAPSESGVLEFLIRKVPGGRLSTFIHQNLHPGDQLSVIGPFGDFGKTKSQLELPPTVWVAGGTGIAPFCSMLRQAESDNSLLNREIWLFFSVHSPGEIFLHDWLRRLERDYPGFHYLPSVSENPENRTWDGEIGRLPSLLKKQIPGILNACNVPGEKSVQALICGSAGLVEVSRAIMASAGMASSAIFFDRFI